MLLIFDILLALTLVWLAYHTLSRRDLFKSIVLFITYGVLLSLVWVRLGSVDLALVEVAIGAGITGALFLNTLGRMQRIRKAGEGAHDPQTPVSASEVDAEEEER